MNNGVRVGREKLTPRWKARPVPSLRIKQYHATLTPPHLLMAPLLSLF